MHPCDIVSPDKVDLVATTTMQADTSSTRRRRQRFGPRSQIVASMVAAFILLVASVDGFATTGSTVNHSSKSQMAPARFGTTINPTQQYTQSPALYAKKQTKKDTSDETKVDDERILGLKKSPGTLLAAPFVFIFGLDLVLNILAITRRSLEVALTGEYTVWAPWQNW